MYRYTCIHCGNVEETYNRRDICSNPKCGRIDHHYEIISKEEENTLLFPNHTPVKWNSEEDLLFETVIDYCRVMKEYVKSWINQSDYPDMIIRDIVLLFDNSYVLTVEYCEREYVSVFKIENKEDFPKIVDEAIQGIVNLIQKDYIQEIKKYVEGRINYFEYFSMKIIDVYSLGDDVYKIKVQYKSREYESAFKIETKENFPKIIDEVMQEIQNLIREQSKYIDYDERSYRTKSDGLNPSNTPTHLDCPNFQDKSKSYSQAFREGQESIIKQLHSVLEEFGVYSVRDAVTDAYKNLKK